MSDARPSRRAESWRANPAAGFGLLEMTIAMAVMGVITAGLVSMLFRTQTTFEIQQVDMDMRQQARVALDTMSTELRLAGYRTGNVPEALSRAGVNVIQFAGDVDDGAAAAPCDAGFEDAVNGGVERITYELVTGALERTVECWDGSSWTVEYARAPVARGLVGPQALFEFFDASGNQIVPVGAELDAAQRASVRVVSISMNMFNVATAVEGPDNRSFALASRVRLPNAS